MEINNTKDFNKYQILLLELQESIALIKQENCNLNKIKELEPSIKKFINDVSKILNNK